VPLSIKLGDVDLDGFPDMLIITTNGKERTPSLLFSVPCSKGTAGCGPDGSGKRGWKVATKEVKALSDIKDARSVSFLDMDEDVGPTFLSSFSAVVHVSHRDLLMSWCKGLDALVKAIFPLFKTTYTTMRSSSKR
jgi:hypothetical protein